MKILYKKEKKKKFLTIRVDDKLFNDFDELCRIYHFKKSDFVRQLITMELFKYGKN